MEELWNRKAYFAKLFSEHLLISFSALALVILFGISIGVFVFYNKKARTFIMPTVNFLYTIPSIAMFGLLIPLVGIGLYNSLIVLVLYGLLPIVRNTYTGMKEVPISYVEVAKGLGSTEVQLFRKIYFPLALPSILSGMRVTTVMVIALASLAAMIGAGGLGEAIFRGLNTMNTPLIVAGSLSVSLFAILGDKFVGLFEKENSLQRFIAHNASRKQKRLIRLNMFTLIILLFIAFLYLNPLVKAERETITVASKPTSEQFILGEILAQSIEKDTNIGINRKFGIGGGTTNIQPAMLSGELDMYVEYTGTALMNVLKKSVDEAKSYPFSDLQKDYKKKFNLKWLGLLGLNNTYALAILKVDAKTKNIATFSDLARQSEDFTLGAEFDFFERRDAYQGLIKVYPFHFRTLEEMDINLRYKAIEEGKVNVVDAFTTDAQIDALQLKVLKDDKHYFPEYKAGIIVRQEILDKYPELEPLLNRLIGKISTDKMREMNYKVEVLGKTPKEVATEFLMRLK